MDLSCDLLVGCHLSIGRGLSSAAEEARALGNSALQIFSRNPMRWRATPLSDCAVDAFRRGVELARLRFVAIHGIYLANFATPDDALHQRSSASLVVELERAGTLGVPWVVTHLGAHMGSGIGSGVRRIAAGIERALDSVTSRCADVGVLLENTAGAGSTVGASFGELGEVLSRLPGRSNLGVCLDSCHALAAGYDLRTRPAVDAVVTEFDREIGLDRLRMVHLNDSAAGLGSHIDRHEHLGRGGIGAAGLMSIINHPRLRRLPFLLETPKTIDGRAGADEVNLSWVRSVRTCEEGT
jgi:deoxyribonuclease-4